MTEFTPYTQLRLASRSLDDTEGARKMAHQRAWALQQPIGEHEDETGHKFQGYGLPAEHPQVVMLVALEDALLRVEAQAIKDLEKIMAQHPLGPWMKEQKGIGLKQGARLLGEIGDPYWSHATGAPRTVSQLWAYCGLHVSDDGSAMRRQKGQQANWRSVAKSRAYLIAVSIVKQPKGAKWRDIYDAGRAKYAGAVHMTPCVRCGPSGSPAQIGSPISAGHQHARAIRLVSKEVLKELWRESARVTHGVNAALPATPLRAKRSSSPKVGPRAKAQTSSRATGQSTTKLLSRVKSKVA